MHHRRRPRARVAAGLLAGLLPVLVAAAPPAPPPLPPPPLPLPTALVLADRDVVVVDGLPVDAHPTVTVAVFRGGGVAALAAGPARPGTGDGAGVVAGAPGGCWVDAAGRPTTAALRPGDVVAVTVDGAPAGTTGVPDVGVDGPAELRGTTVVVRGHAPPHTDPALLEHRIADPALTATELGRDDVRAVAGAPRRAAGGGAVSQLTVTGAEVTATYLFDDPGTAARVAAAPGSRLTVWSDAPPGARRGAVVVGGPSSPRPCAPTPPPTAPEAVPLVGPSGLVLLAPTGASIYYTTDGTDPRSADGPAPTARRYSGLVVVPVPRTVVSWTVFDQVTGLFGPRRTAVFDPPR